MTNGHPAITQQVRTALEVSGVFEKTDEIQCATRMTARFGFFSSTILVFNTGTIVVQGRPSPLHAWLQGVKHCIERSQVVPPFLWPIPETPQKSGSNKK